MSDNETEFGWLTRSEMVTDGFVTWLETQRYLYYSPEEADALFAEHIKDNKWTVVNE